MVMDFNNSKDLWSTGSKAKDILGGLAIGLGNINNRPGQYYVQANYRGDGLANTGLGYIQNQNYQNPYDQANLLTSILYNKKGGQQSKQNLSQSPYTLQGDLKNPPYEGYGEAYGLPLQNTQFNTSWLNSYMPSQYGLGQGYSIPQGLGFLNR